MPAKRSSSYLPHLVDWRSVKGVTQIELAERADVAVSTIRRAEAGESVNAISAGKIARALGITVRELREVDPADRVPDANPPAEA